MDNSQYYKFTMTPTTSTTVGQLTITNTKDVNNFVYPSLYSLANLSFLTILPIPTIWYDFSNSSTFTLSGSNIASVKNVSNTGINTLGISSSIVYNANSLNGKGTIYFNNPIGSNNRFVLTNSTIGSTFDAFIVHKVRSLASGNGMILSGSGIYFGSYKKNSGIGYNHPDASLLNNQPFSLNVWHVTHTRFTNGGGTYVTVDSATGPTFTPYLITNWTTIQIGSFSGSHQEDADLAEIRIYNGNSLGATDITNIKEGMKTKWGIV
jgi:hypothetical protein